MARGSSPSAPLVARRSRTPWSSAPAPGLDLVWVPAGGGDTHLISPARGASRPHFGPEPDRVYVTTPAGLVSMRFDGTDRRTHVQVVGKKALFGDEPGPAEVILLRPDGSWALALVTNQVYLMALPRFGGEPPKVDVHASPVPLKKLTDIGADYLAWADDGKTITWAMGPACSASLLTRSPSNHPRKTKRRKTAPVPPRRRTPRNPRRSPSSLNGRGPAPRDRSSSRARGRSRCAATK